MGTVYAVRHGQASFGTEDYDRLTETGFTQARLLGEHFARRGVRFAASFAGTLRRHQETFEGIASGMRASGIEAPAALVQSAQLNEYDPEAVLEAELGHMPLLGANAHERDPEQMRAHFRALRTALISWAEGRTTPRGMPSFDAFQGGVVGILELARLQHADQDVLIVSSGGPISALVAAVLEAPPRTAIELNLRLRNSGVSEFAVSTRRQNLLAFNSVAHLEGADGGSLITFA